MKFLVVAFLCTLAAVQGRSAFSETAAAPGENPHLVHIRLATTYNNGLLSTCAGSLIGSNSVLTSSSCIRNSRFIWLRFGAVDVSRPELVAEGNFAATFNGDLAILNVTRFIDETDNVGRVALATAESELPTDGKYCGYGAVEDAPGSLLSCSNVSLEASESGILASTKATKFDLGAPLLSGSVQVGVLTAVGESTVFTSVAAYRSWITQVTGI